MSTRPPRKFTTINGVNTMNPEYLEWKKQQVETTEPGTEPKQPSYIIDKMTVEITVLQGRDLVAKDRNMFGKKTSSDPYVSVSLSSSSSPKSMPGQSYNKNQQQQNQLIKLGKTKTVQKTLSPTWNYSLVTSIPFNKKNDKNVLVFQIFDEDKLSSDDSMGVLKIPVIFEDSQGTPSWHEVPKDSAKNASGEIQLTIKTLLHRAQGLTPYC